MKWEDQAKALAAEIKMLENKALKLGLWTTFCELGKIQFEVGWEIDERIEREKVKNKYRINTDGFMEMDSTTCPKCDGDKLKFIGFGSYPTGGLRSKMKPNAELAIAFECQKCFTKCVHHGDESIIKMEIGMAEEEAKTL